MNHDGEGKVVLIRSLSSLLRDKANYTLVKFAHSLTSTRHVEES